MILNSLDKQFKLAENGQITWQKDLTNPMPGEAVAIIKKGNSTLSPSCDLIEAEALKTEDKEAVLKFIQEWLDRYIKTELEPLFKLHDEDIAEGAAKEIAQTLHDNLGILPRADLENLISQMDEEKRATLRTKKIRFGPLIVFLPELNKPATVRLRGLLLTLWNERNLPAQVPADGIVSFSVAGEEVDPIYYRSIGYPVYGPRAVRVDMLDRVICAVYDTAEEGKFKAQHQMAEWLGSNIADLYAVLEAMGHEKIYDPADQKTADEAAEKVQDMPEKGEKQAGDKPDDKLQEKPELATFRLKKGKAIDPKKKALNSKKLSSNKKKLKSKKSKPKKEQRQKVYTAEAESNPEDSPFAILQQLKVGNKDK